MVALGYIDGRAHTNLVQFDVIKQDIVDSPNNDIRYSRRGSFSRKAHHFAKANLSFDFLDTATLASIQKVMGDSERKKIFVKHPAGADQFCNFYGITSPSATHKITYADSDLEDLGYDPTNQLSSAQYGYLGEIDGDYVDLYAYEYAYKYFFIKFTPTYTFTGKNIERISLLLHNAFACETTLGAVFNQYNGLQVCAYNQALTSWLEIDRINFTPPCGSMLSTTQPFIQHVSTLKPVNGFTKIADFLTDGSIYFRVRNLIPRTTGSFAVYVGFNYLELIIDGFPVEWTGGRAFPYRDSVTINGYQGQMELSEQ